MSDIIWLQPIPKTNSMSFQEGSDKALYKNPCLMYMGEDINKLVDSLDNQAKATPGKYFIQDTGEDDTVRLFLSKCPDGYEQNVRQSRCELRPGIDGEALCKKIDPLTRRSEIDLLTEHLEKVVQQRG